MEKFMQNEAARILVEDAVYSGGDHARPSEMLARFRQWQKGKARASNEHAYPEFTGFYSTYLIQMWRDTNRQNAHYVARGNLETGTIDGGALYDVIEMSQHKDISELSSDQQMEVCYYLESQPLRDFADVNGSFYMQGSQHELYASVDRIIVTQDNECPERVRDLVELDAAMYHQRMALGKGALQRYEKV